MYAEVTVFTFKAGLLARLAHDLKLRVPRFEIALERSSIDAWFDASAWQIEGVVKGQQLDTRVLSEHDKQQILQTVREEILRVSEFPRIELRGQASELGPEQVQVRGHLTLRGDKRPLTLTAQRRDSQLRARVELEPSRFGIAPYKALGGAIRLQDRVVVEVTLELETKTPRELLDSTDVITFVPKPAG